ncbi:MAG: hypothetical protein DHS20C19_06330 [Acidimicrobiales bacterium]|nr:MAG: hypothetical protein DHS20C19_06330 [Acidimicrobiales bacterium]
MATIFELTEGLLGELGTATTVAEIETGFRSLSDRFAAVPDTETTDAIRDGYVIAMNAWADLYVEYRSTLESANPDLDEIEAFAGENLAITETVSLVDTQLFEALDAVLRARGTEGAAYLADLLGPIAEYSTLFLTLVDMGDLRPSEEIAAWSGLVDETTRIRLAIEDLSPTLRLIELHTRQVGLLADTEELFQEFLELILSGDEPGASLFLALGAIERDGLALRDERGAAVTDELRGASD